MESPLSQPQHDDREQRSRSYEIMVILSGGLSDEEAQGKADELKQLISQSVSNVEPLRSPTRLKLSYPIAQQQQGVFCVFEAMASTSSVKEISEKVKRFNGVLRHHITYATPKQAVTKPRPPRVVPPKQELPKPADTAKTISTPPKPLEERDLDKTIKDILEEKLI